MKVSVIIPCHNVEAHIDRALASAMAQTHPDIEVVCVDDGSTDGTAAILHRWSAEASRPIRVLQQENRGASAARNRGMAECDGPWIQFLDADDAIAPGKVARQVALVEAHPDTDLVVGDYESVMPNGLLLPALALYDRAWMGLIKTRLGTTSANLWKREAVAAAGGWPEDLRSSQDYALMFHMLRHGARVVWDRVIGTEVLKRPSGSISQTSVHANWGRYVALRRAMKEHLAATDPVRYKEEIATLEQYIFMALRIMAVKDRRAAVAEFRRSIGRGFVPEVGRAITERYVLLYKLLGFAGAERLLEVIGRPQHPPV
ncbi:MAG: glycosyltransferase family 2 protein [Flavobacteriales bacterium]|nr:glycosyltransferase family 2 protein [Flavobacteriales bacterium]MCB9166337.1 glycosyltransferase family 2 protein [Flavobacteriales bacterium]